MRALPSHSLCAQHTGSLTPVLAHSLAESTARKPDDQRDRDEAKPLGGGPRRCRVTGERSTGRSMAICASGSVGRDRSGRSGE